MKTIRKQKGFVAILGGFFILVFVAILVIPVYASVFTEEKIVGVVVESKERVTTSNSDGKVESKYLIFTDKEVFENTDTLLRGKFSSSDFYGKIKVGQTCDFDVIGWRVPFLSMYRNIIGYDCR